MKRDANARRADLVRRGYRPRCSDRCPCICHEVGHGHDHVGRPCPGKQKETHDAARDA